MVSANNEWEAPKMSDKMYPPSAELAASAHANAAKYAEMYAASVNDPDAFWGEQGKRLDWIKPYSVGLRTAP
jgi:acetyl-CoA synthetase